MSFEIQYDDKGRRHWKQTDRSHSPESKPPEETKAKPVPIDYSRALEARESKIKLDNQVGIRKIAAEDKSSSKYLGYYCKPCDFSVNDSLAWLDHLNSEQHNRMHGNLMKVEKVTVDAVEQRLKELKQKKPKKRPPTIEEIMKRLDSKEPEPSKKQKITED
ncbi:unnamed protein product [Blepharisma stoltei]|uniref:Zinc finger double-stranded RNA binding domain-containing protein n=1 Tax=Blepharisma stoltei TaxID=1481888 RepID=A0AAU9J208_9CILI|nr:unnamed protein product [Blepharisma stoltei]